MDLELYKKNAYASHQPIVRHVLSLIEDLPILELGSGDGSTNLIHELSQNFKITVDSDEGWISKYRHLENKNHKFLCIKNFDEWFSVYDQFNYYGLVFVDQGCWTSRAKAIEYLKNKSKFIILHDCCYYPKTKQFGQQTSNKSSITCCSVTKQCPCGDMQNYTRTYSDVFTYFKEFISPYGPPTLLGSNSIDVSEIHIDMLK